MQKRENLKVNNSMLLHETVYAMALNCSLSHQMHENVHGFD
jgi:hypothetical protein